MKKKTPIQQVNAKIREKAEALFLKKYPEPAIVEEKQKLLYELQVHQIELEMQNEELNMLRHRAELMLENFTNLYNFAPIAYLTLAKNSLILNVNHAAIKLFNQPISKLLRQRLGIYVVDDYKPIFNAFIEQAFNSHTLEHCEVSATIDDKFYWLMLSGIVDSSKECLLVTVLDFTQRKLEEDKLKLASMVYESLDEPILVLDTNHNIIAINSAFTKLTGFSSHQTIGQPMWFFYDDVKQEKTFKNIFNSLNQMGCWQGDIRFPCANGVENFERLKINTVYDSGGQVLWHLLIFFDITQQKIANDIIKRQAYSDLLTGLANRRSFQFILQKQLQKSKLEQSRFAVMFLDIDRFKSVNDVFGHEIGDQLLKETAVRLQKCIRQKDVIARSGGDEFIFLITDITDYISIERICHSIFQNIREPFYLGNNIINITVSIGIALYPNDAKAVKDLLKKADQAMYAAKSKGRDCHSYYTQEMQHYFTQRDSVANELTLAIEKKQLVLYYAPIRHLKTTKASKAEAVLYWRHPKLGLLKAEQFMLIATEMGLYDKINQWMLKEVTCQVQMWRKKFDKNFEIFVRIFSPKIAAPHLNLTYFENHDFSSLGIVLELSERFFIEDRKQLVNLLSVLKEQGFKFLINHFGMKASLFELLSEIKIDYIKTDSSFFLAEKNSILCETLILMMHKLKVKVIVDLPKKGKIDLFKHYECDYLQELPLPKNEFVKLLNTTIHN
jgi:diguanylate cyclase (GGDEF)-like protein/PAS domain S-box-containing protein